MTEQQRKAIEILNSLREPMILSEERALTEDDYFFLLSFIIEKPSEVYIPQPCPSIMPWPSPIQPYYGGSWEVTCKPEESDK